MTITLSGSVITVAQDAVPSDIVTALPAVGTTTDYGHYKITNIASPYKLDIKNILTISLTDRLNGNTGQFLRATASTSHIVLDGRETINGVVFYFNVPILTGSHSRGGASGTYAPGDALVHLDVTGSKLTWQGGSVEAKQPFVFDSNSEVIIENAVMDALGHITTYANMYRIFTAKFKIHSLTLRNGQSLVDMAAPDTSWNAEAGFKNIINESGSGFGTSGSQFKKRYHEYGDYVSFDASFVDGGYWAQVLIQFKNSITAPKDLKLVGFSSSSSNSNIGFARVDKELTITIKDFVSNNLINASGKVFIPLTFTDEMPDGTTSWGDGIDYSSMSNLVFDLTNGTGSETIIRAVNERTTGGAQGSPTDALNILKYTNSDGSNNYNIRVASYGYQLNIATIDIVDHSGDVLLKADEVITERNKAVVDAYTELDTPQKFYDRAKAHLIDNYAGETALLVARNGQDIDAGSLNVTIDATASDVFSASSDTLTIKATTFTGDIKTTGTVTLANGARVVGGIIDANGDSFLSFDSIDSWTAYSTDADRSAKSNPLGNGSGSDAFRFTYSPGTSYFLSLVIGDETVLKTTTPSQSGATAISLGTSSQLSALSVKLDEVADVGKVARDHARAANVQTQATS